MKGRLSRNGHDAFAWASIAATFVVLLFVGSANFAIIVAGISHFC